MIRRHRSKSWCCSPAVAVLVPEHKLKKVGVGEAAVKRRSVSEDETAARAIYNIKRVAEAGLDLDVQDINSL